MVQPAAPTRATNLGNGCPPSASAVPAAAAELRGSAAARPPSVGVAQPASSGIGRPPSAAVSLPSPRGRKSTSPRAATSPSPLARRCRHHFYKDIPPAPLGGLQAHPVRWGCGGAPRQPRRRRGCPATPSPPPCPSGASVAAATRPLAATSTPRWMSATVATAASAGTTRTWEVGAPSRVAVGVI